MTEIVIVPAAPAVPPFPALGDPAFNSKAYDWGVALPGVSNTVQAIAVTAHTNATVAKEKAAAAGGSAIAAVEGAALASDWAAKSGAPVAGDEYSAKHYAQVAQGAVASIPAGTINDAMISPASVWSSEKVSDAISAISSISDLLRSDRTSSTVLVEADKGKLIDITGGTFTQTFAAAATLGDGWWCYLRSSGSGDIALDPSGAELIDGLTGYVMYPGEVRLVQCDGVALRSIVLNAFYKTFTASGNFIKPPGYPAFVGELDGAGASGARRAATVFREGGCGGARAPFAFAASALSATESVVIGAGGASVVTNSTAGAPGGNSVFMGITAYGAAASQGGPAYSQSSTNPALLGATASAAFAHHAFYGGGGANTGTDASYGSTVYGGQAGQSISSSGVALPLPLTIFGKPGGTTNDAGTAPTAGQAPGGGGGASTNGAASGPGARGELRIWGII